jgi:6-phosphogluconolactonase
MQAFVGTYTRKEGHVDGKAKGIYQLELDSGSSRLLRVGTIPDIINPSFVNFDPKGRFLYAVSEIGGGADTTGYVYAYALDGQEVKFLNRQVSHGMAPCHVVVHPSGKYAFAANYMGGIAMYPINEDGSLAAASDVRRLEGSGPTARQKSSHPHSVTLDADGRFAYVADLGTDKIMIFFINQEAGKLEPAGSPFAQLAPGAGPRHLVFHPNGQLLYAINELNSTITSFRYDRADGHLQALQTVSTLPMDFNGNNSCADIHLTPDGRFLYGSNRGHNSIAIFSVDPGTGSLEPMGHQSTGGEVPRNFAIDPFGKVLYVANQNSDNIVYLKIGEDGSLEKIGELYIPTPVCLQFRPVVEAS